MIHIIVILHFLSISVGLGCVVLSLFCYHKNKTGFFRGIIVGESAFLGAFLLDSIAIYLRTAVVEHSLETVMTVFSYVFWAILIVSIIFTGRSIIERRLYQNVAKWKILLLGVTLVMMILFLLSQFIDVFREVPYLCIIYLLQSVLVILCLWNSVIIQKGADNERGNQKEKRSSDTFPLLTGREREVVNFICDGLSNKEIAERMFISSNTIKNHVSNIYRKLGVKNKVELINLINRGE